MEIKRNPNDYKTMFAYLLEERGFTRPELTRMTQDVFSDGVIKRLCIGSLDYHSMKYSNLLFLARLLGFKGADDFVEELEALEEQYPRDAYKSKYDIYPSLDEILDYVKKNDGKLPMDLQVALAFRAKLKRKYDPASQARKLEILKESIRKTGFDKMLEEAGIKHLYTILGEKIL